MSVADALRRARALVASGWSPTFSKTAGGSLAWDREVTEFVSVEDAVWWSAESDDEAVAAMCWLEEVACPNYCAFNRAMELCHLTGEAKYWEAARFFAKRYRGDLQAWLATPRRRLREVLNAFDTAMVRAVL